MITRQNDPFFSHLLFEHYPLASFTSVFEDPQNAVPWANSKLHFFGNTFVDVPRNIVVLFSTKNVVFATSVFLSLCSVLFFLCAAQQKQNTVSSLRGKMVIAVDRRKNLSRFSSMSVQNKVNLLVGKQKKYKFFLKVWDGSNMPWLLLFYFVSISNFFCFHLVPTNYFYIVLRLFDVLPNFRFTTREKMCDYYL